MAPDPNSSTPPANPPTSETSLVLWARRVAEHGRTAATISAAASVCVSLAAWMVTDHVFFFAPLAYAIGCCVHLLLVFHLLTRLVAAEGEAWRRPWYRWLGLYALTSNVTMYALFILGASLSATFVPTGPTRSASFAFLIAAWGTSGLPLILALPSYATLWSLTLVRFARVDEERTFAAERDLAQELIRHHRTLLHRLARFESNPEHAIAHAEALRRFDDRLKALGREIPHGDREEFDPQDACVWIDESMCDPEFQPRSLHDER
jgi:hypothetical protein